MKVVLLSVVRTFFYLLRCGLLSLVLQFMLHLYSFDRREAGVL